MKVRIKKLPQARTGYQVQGSLANDVPAMGGADYNTYIGQPKARVSKYITAVPREDANLEAEGGETVYGDINGDGMAEHKIIKGPRHSGGGVPLNLPDDTFIYSDFRGMNIKEPELLTMFGKSGNKKGKKSYTPAELAKQYDIEKYRKILQDPNSDKIDRKTAELMIKNYQNKLAALALVQEAHKGFPQGVAKASDPFMQENEYSEATFMSPEIKQFGQQIDGKLAQEETDNSNTELQDNELAEAEDLNQGQPVAQPQEMEQPMAQYGMAMGGYDFPYEESMPEAEYGMAMGANPRNYMGRPKSPMYARGGALERYQEKGAVATSEEIDITGMTPEQARRARHDYKIRMRKEGKTFTEPKYFKTVDGKKKSVEYKGPGGGQTANTPDEIKAVNAAQEKMFEEQLKDPKIRQKMYENTVKAMKDRDSYIQADGKVSEKAYNAYSEFAKDPKNLNPDIVAQRALAQIKRGNRMKEAGINTGMFINNGSELDSPANLVKRGIASSPAEAKKLIAQYQKNKWTSVNNATTAVGESIPKMDEVAVEQASSRGYVGMMKELKSGAYSSDPDLEYAATNFLGDPADDKSGKGKFNLNTGATDEVTTLGSEYGEISPIDGVRGNTSAGHGIGAGQHTGEFVEGADIPDKPGEVKPADAKVEKKCPCKKSDGSEVETGTDANGECLPCEEEVPVDVPKEPAKFWLQDNLKTAGAFANLMDIKKQMPWAPKADLVAPKPTFLDPTRELAANAEQANIQSQAMAQFAGPQALSARASGVMGAASKNAADIMSKYNNANVNLANQFETNIANVENQERQLNMAAQSKLYDQNTIANQQYDNAKRQARNQLVNQVANSFTNRAKTDALNQMYPQYDTHPETGGMVNYDPSKGKQAKPVSTKDISDLIAECKQDGLTDQRSIMECVKVKRSATGGGEASPDLSAIQAQFQGQEKQGLPNGRHGGFMYGDITFPFVL